jgi:D5 N terminal like
MLADNTSFLQRERKYIHLANCVLEFDEKGRASAHDFSPDYTSLAASPFKYNPEADCPKFKREIAHMGEHLETLQRMAGTSLWSVTKRCSSIWAMTPVLGRGGWF